MQKITSALKNPVMWVGVAVGVVLSLAYSRFIPRSVAKVAAVLPGAK